MSSALQLLCVVAFVVLAVVGAIALWQHDNARAIAAGVLALVAYYGHGLSKA